MRKKRFYNSLFEYNMVGNVFGVFFFGVDCLTIIGLKHSFNIIWTIFLWFFLLFSGIYQIYLLFELRNMIMEEPYIKIYRDYISIDNIKFLKEDIDSIFVFRDKIFFKTKENNSISYELVVDSNLYQGLVKFSTTNKISLNP